MGWTASSFYSVDLVESGTSCSGFAALETVPNRFMFQEFSVFRKRMLITYFLSGCKVLETMPGVFYISCLLQSWHSAVMVGVMAGVMAPSFQVRLGRCRCGFCSHRAVGERSLPFPVSLGLF